MEALVTAMNIEKSFGQPVLTGVSLSLFPGERVALVGESGCGKTTMARILAGLLAPDKGEIQWRSPKPQVAMVFQDASSSFNPKRSMGLSLIEPMENQKIHRQAAKDQMVELLTQCGLGDWVMERYPHQLSGGQCQRAALARALSTKPDMIICDEVTSALDDEAKSQILDLLDRLQQTYGMTYLCITHDKAVAEKFCTRQISV